MNWKRRLRSIEQYIAVVSRWIGYVSIIGTIVVGISGFFEWGKKGPFGYLADHAQALWLWMITFTAAVLVLWVSWLHRRFAGGFSDSFRGDWQINWDFEGPWRVAEKDTLLVTGSDAGGITKVGATWENYTLAFKGRIIRECLGVVVRAQDLNNYYMLQIRPDKIRPHRRVAVPVMETQVLPHQEEGTPQLHPIKFTIGWQVFDPPTPLSSNLVDWFDVKVIARGQSVSLYIDHELVFQRDRFLQIPMGKVGFRNSGSEEAIVRKVKVTLQP